VIEGNRNALSEADLVISLQILAATIIETRTVAMEIFQNTVVPGITILHHPLSYTRQILIKLLGKIQSLHPPVNLIQNLFSSSSHKAQTFHLVTLYLICIVLWEPHYMLVEFMWEMFSHT